MDWNEYPNFSEKEFDHGGPAMHEEFMRKLQLARSICTQICREKGIPEISFVITSGSRDEERNRQVGGKPDSTHLIGRACDIAAATSRSMLLITKSLLLAGFTRVGISGSNNFIHVDDAELSDHPICNRKDDANVLWPY